MGYGAGGGAARDPHRLGDFALLVHMGVKRGRAAVLAVRAGLSSLLGWAIVVALGEQRRTCGGVAASGECGELSVYLDGGPFAGAAGRAPTGGGLGCNYCVWSRECYSR